jgi:anti-sigma factor (TIGR02949 family)
MTILNRLSCEEAFRRLDDYLDRNLSELETTLIREHLDTCEACAREFRFEGSLLAGIRTKLRQVELPQELQAKISALILQERGKQQPD